MERVGTLINKLKEQFDQHADAEKLAVTAQLLLSELQKNHTKPSVAGKISVVLPSVSRTSFADEPEIKLRTADFYRGSAECSCTVNELPRPASLSTEMVPPSF